jgi:formylglycine-generating enzyme required for sulfatase activity
VAPSVELYACSQEGSIPSANVTWYQAKRGCENAGKRLCTTAEWRAACAGPQGRAFPYGDVYEPSFCNGHVPAPGGTWPTGGGASCEGGVAGLFDFSGNVSEWTTTCASVNCDRRGGSFVDYEDLDTLRCDAGGDRGPRWPREDIGFRCCQTPAS